MVWKIDVELLLEGRLTHVEGRLLLAVGNVMVDIAFERRGPHVEGWPSLFEVNIWLSEGCAKAIWLDVVGRNDD